MGTFVLNRGLRLTDNLCSRAPQLGWPILCQISRLSMPDAIPLALIFHRCFLKTFYSQILISVFAFQQAQLTCLCPVKDTETKHSPSSKYALLEEANDSRRLILSFLTIYLTQVLLWEFHKPVAYRIMSQENNKEITCSTSMTD